MRLLSHPSVPVFFLVSFFQVLFDFDACAQPAKKDYIILHGVIKNLPPQPDGRRQIELSFPYEFNLPDKKIEVAEDGSFRDTLPNQTGVYTIWDEKTPVLLYMDRSKRYSIGYDADHFKDGAVLAGGDDVSINQYFILRAQQRQFFDPSGEGMNEEAFRKFLYERKLKSLTRIRNAKLPSALTHSETQATTYEYLSNLFLFLALRELEDPAFRPGMISQKELAINYSNEDHYRKYGQYRRLVFEYYQRQLRIKEAEFLKTDSSYSLTQNRISLLASIVPNEYIRNKQIAEIALFDLKQAGDIIALYSDFEKYYTGDDERFREKMADAFLRLTRLKKGTPSPEFSGYLNYNGGTSSLSDFRGKYVYIDLWASWCGNCPGEVPYLKELMRKYEAKNIAILSISVDKDAAKWTDAIKRQKMEGIQLLASDQGGSFTKEYAVYGIPRYILIDPAGAIVEYNAPRPSDTAALAALLASVGL
ncbi:TlpA family protein disulfide reductase [Terrimonas sp. NA20]|uniref:TlpA family protein disulfide reductase n=1 Tax=Terrimonas ginsenosidimutans TaxID=2908004 RepID=A0ABS9KME7_9BACT|nr:TlpA disulfide reductase family protein [Terrimonas ginsenosidimutans]MCG2613497.1 TlpA family protein disulfide reductase [Terrimonas ginsenosidimutans]